jgi:hypothetical protein
MSFLGLNLTQWTAIAAIAGIILAAATVAILIYAICSGRSDRLEDVAKREEDRKWDSDRRAEDREHAEQLRREDDAKWERRFRAEQLQAQDAEARQVIVQMVTTKDHLQERYRGSEHQITVSAPEAYPIRQVEAQLVHNSGSGIGVCPVDNTGTGPAIENGRCVIRMLTDVPDRRVAPIVRFTDRHGNRYYTYRQLTQRIPHDDWVIAARELDRQYRTGPDPGEENPPAA